MLHAVFDQVNPSAFALDEIVIEKGPLCVSCDFSLHLLNILPDSIWIYSQIVQFD